jgi:hypothetical protein
MENRLAMLILTIVISIGAGAITPGYAAKFSAPARAGIFVADRAAAAPALNPNPGCFPSGKVETMYYPRQYSQGTFCLRSHVQGDFRVVSGSLLLRGKSYPVLGTWEYLGETTQLMNLTVNRPRMLGLQILFGLDWVSGGNTASGPIPWTNHWRRP